MRYRRPSALPAHAASRILLTVERGRKVGELVNEARRLYPRPAWLGVLVPLSHFEWAMNHPEVDAAVCGQPDLSELTAAWRIDHLLPEAPPVYPADRLT